MIGRFTSHDNHAYVVIIGDAITTMQLSADPVHISWEKGEHLYVPVRSVSASIRILSKTDLSGLYTANPLGRKVTIIRDGTTIFAGFLTPQEWSAPSDPTWNEVEVIAVDAISALKMVNYNAYPAVVTPQTLIESAIDTLHDAGANITFDASTLPWNRQAINNRAFLPKFGDVSIHSQERFSYADIFEALGTFLGGTFMMEGATIKFKAVDSVLVQTPVFVDEWLDGATTSIEPARSSVQVDYADMNENDMDFTPDETRMEGDEWVYADIAADGSGTNETCIARYHMSKDWNSNYASTPACHAQLSKGFDVLNGLIDEEHAIVGPAQMKMTTRPCYQSVLSDAYVSIEFDIWARSGLSRTTRGYYILPIYRQTSNISTVPVTINGQTRNLVLDTSKKGFQTVTTTIFKLGSTKTISVRIPDECVIKGFRVKISRYEQRRIDATIPIIPGVRLDKVKDDGLVSIDNSYNSQLSVSAKLRSCIQAWSASDVEVGIEDDYSALDFDKFPFVNIEQYRQPRRRMQLETPIKSFSFFTAYDLLTDGTYAYIADSADFNLNSGTVDLGLLQTHQTI